MTREPLISVLTAFHNEEPQLLQRCIESVLDEEDLVREFILVDDASSNFAELSLVIPSGHPRIHLIRNEKNLGLTASLNKGLQVSRGKYIARLDSNDFNCEGRLSKQVSFLEENSGYGLCGTLYKEIKAGVVVPSRVHICLEDADIREAFNLFNPFAHSTLMIRHELMKEIGNYRSFFYYSQDYDLTRRLLKKSKGKNLNDYLVMRHVGKNDISCKKYKKQLFYAVITRFLYLKDHFRLRGLLGVLKSITVLCLPESAIVKLRKHV